MWAGPLYGRAVSMDRPSGLFSHLVDYRDSSLDQMRRVAWAGHDKIGDAVSCEQASSWSC